MGLDHSTALLDRLLHSLAELSASPHPGARARSDVFDAILDLSASLDPVRHPEVCAQLQAVCDVCLTYIGNPSSVGRARRIDATLTLITAIRDALGSRAGASSGRKLRAAAVAVALPADTSRTREG